MKHTLQFMKHTLQTILFSLNAFSFTLCAFGFIFLIKPITGHSAKLYTSPSIQKNKTSVFATKKTSKNNSQLLKGKTTNFSDVKKDGQVDFGLTLLSLNLSEIWNVIPTNFFSTKIVPVPTFTKIKIPANVTLPKQKERYWISINLKKETYELNIPKNKKYIVHTIHGQFPLKKAIKKIQGGNSFISLANLFTFKAYDSHEKNFKNNKKEKIDFDLSKKKIDGNIHVNTSADIEPYEILLLSLLKKKTQYLPFDIKRLINNTSIDLTIPKNSPNQFVLGLLTKKSVEALSEKYLKKQTVNEVNPEALLHNIQTTGVNDSELTLDIDNGYRIKNIADFSNLSLVNKSVEKVQTQSKFLTAQRISIALQKVKNKKAQLSFLSLVDKPNISPSYVSVIPPSLPKNFNAHSSILQLLEMEESFLDNEQKHSVLITTVLKSLHKKQWVKQFDANFIHKWKRDPKKRYAVQIIFLATTNQSSEPSHATRSLQEIFN